MIYLVKRTYQYTTEEWVTADSEREAKKIPASDEARNYDDHWTDSEVIDSQSEPHEL
jgi:hypothetical protein